MLERVVNWIPLLLSPGVSLLSLSSVEGLKALTCFLSEWAISVGMFPQCMASSALLYKLSSFKCLLILVPLLNKARAHKWRLMSASSEQLLEGHLYTNTVTHEGAESAEISPILTFQKQKTKTKKPQQTNKANNSKKYFKPQPTVDTASVHKPFPCSYLGFLIL